MSSSLGLIELVNHLHNLEASFGRILVEAAVKLSQLTDLNLFVLIETPEGRKFAGAGHLCDAYSSGALRPTDADSRLDVDTDTPTVRERPPAASVAAASRHDVVSVEPISVVDVNGLDPGAVFPSSAPSRFKSRKRRSSGAVYEARDSKIRRAGSLVAVKEEDAGPEDDCQVVSDEDDASHNAWRGVGHGDGLEVALRSPSEPRAFAQAPASFDDRSAVAPPTAEESEDWRHGGSAMFLPNDRTILLPDSLRQKMHGLASMTTPNLLLKSTTEYRLFASTVYDFGKLLYRYAPAPKDIKDAYVLVFIAQCVDAFLNHFPFLLDCETKDFKVCGLTITGFVRDRVKGGFKKLMRNNCRS